MSNIFTLTGRSGLGKSAALIRPLRWLLYNQPVGEEFRKWGSKQTRVETFWDNNTGWLVRLRIINFQCHADLDIPLASDTGPLTMVSRVRGNTDNYYVMDGEKYKIGNDRKVPDPIAAYLNVSDINICGQHDPPYLLGLNRHPLELARTMNALAGMSDIDEALSRINGRVKGDQAEVKRLGKNVSLLEIERGRYDGLLDLEMDIGITQALEEQAGVRTDRAGRLQGITDRLSASQSRLSAYGGLDDLTYQVIECGKWAAGRDAKIRCCERLRVLTARLDTAYRTLATDSTGLADSIRDQITQYSELEAQRGKIEGRCKRLEILVRAIDSANATYRNLHTLAAGMGTEFIRLLATSKCPVCGRGGEDE
jgi:hypothetical protein